jgi:hypothetical protein
MDGKGHVLCMMSLDQSTHRRSKQNSLEGFDILLSEAHQRLLLRFA